jgi:hypothetical protein
MGQADSRGNKYQRRKYKTINLRMSLNLVLKYQKLQGAGCKVLGARNTEEIPRQRKKQSEATIPLQRKGYRVQGIQLPTCSYKPRIFTEFHGGYTDSKTSLLSPIFGLRQSADSQLPTSDFQLQTPNSKLQTPNSKLQTILPHHV